MSEPDRSEARRVDHAELESFVRAVLDDAGVADEHAAVLAEAIARADLRGVDSHGVARLETYVRKFEQGGFNPDPDITVGDAKAGFVCVDADDGPGQSAGVTAMDAAMDRAAATGIGAAVVCDSNHFGTAAFYTQRAAAEDFIGLSMTNVGSDVVPFGGAEAFLGTNPLSVSVPTDRSFPITLDMATSVVAMGKIDHVAAEEDTEIPPGWAVDAAGEPTTDPHEVAALRPVGGPKGYGLAIVVDVLCGLLSGAGPSPDVGPLYDAFDEPMRLGHFVAAIDVSAVMAPEAFRAAVGRYIDRLKAVTTRDGVDEVLVPGEPEARTRRRNEREGIPLSEATLASLQRLADEYGIAVPDPV